MNVNVKSEIGELEAVVIHHPGPEVENMTPQNAERALYSDILNLTVADEEYSQFEWSLKAHAKIYEVNDLLTDILKNYSVKTELITQICENENVPGIKQNLIELEAKELSRQLIEGVPLIKNNLTSFMSEERYSLLPLHNFFFTRDASISINNITLIARMRSKVRVRESIIMDAIFSHHPELKTETVNPVNLQGCDPLINIEGGDILVAREDVLCIGVGGRTTTQGVDFILDQLKERNKKRHLFIQELPKEPESFIHLDMVFTFIDKNKVMIYEPVVCNQHAYETVHIEIDSGKVKSITEEDNLIQGLAKVGMDVEPILCGGTDEWTQEREQWHSGANFFAMGPGKVMGYGRNTKTLEELNKHGYEILYAHDLMTGKRSIKDYDKYVIEIDGAELSRGGGGCRCMTMPVRRKDVVW